MKANSIRILLLLLFILNTNATPEWKNHDISTLRLLQIVHRHGERAPLKPSFAATDPFRNVTEFWKEGLGQLSTEGKYRMYKLGQFLRNSYDQYLGKDHSPREVYARSSIEHRCIESVSCLLSGAYPPINKDWQWNNGSDAELGLQWQPFPIETFMPKNEDPMLVPDKKCPKVDTEHNRIMGSKVIKDFLDNYANSSYFKVFNKLFNETIKTLGRGQQLWDTLKIELENGYIWDNLTRDTQQEYVSVLEEFSRLTFVYDWNSTLIRKIRVGKLVETIVTNMNNIVKDKQTDENYKLFIYSTHDSIVAPLLQAFDAFNGLIPTYGSSVIFELHQNNTNYNKSINYFVKIFYFNETLIREPYLMKTVENFNGFYESAKYNLFYDDFDFNKLCDINNNEKSENLILAEMTFMVIGVGIGVALLGFSITVFLCIRQRKRKMRYSIRH